MVTGVRPFLKIRPDRHANNVSRASSLRVVPGLLSHPDASTEPAVILFGGSMFQYALNETQAFNLATRIVAILEANRKPQETI